jgi:hypothetical protein
MINKHEYDALVQKLAEEIVESAMEVEASDHEDDMEVTAGAKDFVRKYIAKNEGTPNIQYLPPALKDLKKAKIKRGLAIGVPAAAVAGGAAAGAYAYSKKRHKGAEKRHKEAEEYYDDIVTKTASVYEEAQLMKEAALQVMAEAEAQYEAALEVLAEAELYEEATMKVAEELEF